MMSVQYGKLILFIKAEKFLFLFVAYSHYFLQSVLVAKDKILQLFKYYK